MMIKGGKKTWTCRKCPPVSKPSSTTTKKNVQNPVKEALRKYYNDVNEEKSDADLDKILKAYENEIPKLASDLKEKYNKTLEIVRESPPSPPASARATKKKKRMVLSEDQHLAVRSCSHYFSLLM
jgi:DNA-binding protein Fis